MASWASQSSPTVKFEVSPAESFMSLPGEAYPSLFATEGGSTTTMDALEIMTPRSFSEDINDLGTTPGAAEDGVNSTATPEKKPVKKRKSWGQVLPEPKTNLPPRKRAKTEDEKEQRRVERVLRNRRAAQSSRERKRQEVEGLELRNQTLEHALREAHKANQALLSELKRIQQECGVAPRLSNALSLSQPLFSSQDDSNPAFGSSKSALIDDIIRPTAIPATVDPARLSPDLAPVPDVVAAEKMAPATSTASTSVDMTQRPAVMLCDLQCHQSTELPRSWPAATAKMPPMVTLLLQLRLSLMGCSVIISACQRPLTQIALALKSGTSLLPTPSILDTIIWLVTLPSSRQTRSTRSTSRTTSTSTATTASHSTPRRPATSPSAHAQASTTTTVFSASRIALLQKILTCSPSLARPLMDATLAVLRLVAEGCEDRVQGSLAESLPKRREGPSRSQEWLNGAPLPSKEVLLTLLWTLRLEERKRDGAERTRASAVPGSEPCNPEPTNHYILAKSTSKKRRNGGDLLEYEGKRRCLG